MNGSKIPFPLTIGQRLLAMVVIFMLALGAILIFTHTAVKTLDFDVVVLDVAGRQRMMIQRHLNEMMLAYHGIQTDLQRTQRVLLHSVDALQNGGDVIVNLYTDERHLIPAAPTARIRELLEQQRVLLEQFFARTKALLVQDPDHFPSSESFSLLNQLQHELQRNADTVFKLFSVHSRQNIANLLRSEPAIGFLVIILSVILARQVVSTSRRLEREIEQRKKAEDERNRFFALSPDLFCIAGLDGRFTVLNPAWEHDLGYSLTELQGHAITAFVHLEDRAALTAELERLKQGPHTVQFENRFLGKDGSVNWLLWKATASPEDHVLYATARNINERKSYEEELALRDRSINSATNGIVIADARQPDMPTVYCNAAFEKITGYAPEEVLGKNCRFLYRTDREQPGLDIIRQAVRQGTEARAEIRNYRKDGSLFWNGLYIAPVNDQQGRLTHFIGIQTDITQQKQQEAELAHKTRELAQSNAELQQFAYVASHDLQEPLRMVASYTQLLGKRYQGKLDKDADEFIGYAVDGATRMQRLIRDLLEYSRVGSENKSLEKTDSEIVFRQVLNNLSASIRERHAKVTHDPLPIVHANPTHLTQLLQNLIGNALKFQGDAPARIHVGAKALPEGWEFSVRDNGVGIPDDQLDRIFSIFQRLHGPSDYPGTGVGLAICKRIVEKYGGTIRVESTLGKGSIFYFTLTTHRETVGPAING